MELIPSNTKVVLDIRCNFLILRKTLHKEKTRFCKLCESVSDFCVPILIDFLFDNFFYFTKILRARIRTLIFRIRNQILNALNHPQMELTPSNIKLFFRNK